MILINRTGKQAYNINWKTQRFGFPDHQSKCKTNCLHLVAGRQSCLADRVTQQHPLPTEGTSPQTLEALPTCSQEMPGLPPPLAAVSLRGHQWLPGMGDLEPPQAVTFSGPLASSQVLFQSESPWPKINSAIFTVASLPGIPDAYVPTWAETGFGKSVWVQQHHQPSSTSLQSDFCLFVPARAILLCCLYMRRWGKGRGWNRLSTKHELSRLGPLNLFGLLVSWRSCMARLGLWLWPGITLSSKAWECLVTELNKSWSRDTQWRVWWTPGSFPIQRLWRSCETMWRGVQYLSHTSSGLLELRTQAPSPARAEDAATCPLHLVSPQAEFMPLQKSLHVSLPEFCVPAGRLSSQSSQ